MLRSGRIHSLAAILIMIAMITAGCAFGRLNQATDVLSNSTILVGMVSGAGDCDRGPVIVAAYSKKGNVRTVAHYTALHEPGPYELIVPKGDYHIFAFVDEDHDLVFDEGEPAGQYVRSAFISVTAGGVVPDVDIVMSDEKDSGVDFPAGATVCQEPCEPVHFTSPGVIVDLDEPCFDEDIGVKGYWEPLEFYRKYGGNIYFTAPYDPSRIPVLFVHGAGGTPRIWRVIADGIDKDSFQTWFYYYPSGASIESMSHLLLWKILNLQRKYQFDTLYIVAHSMGGLVVRSFLVNFGEGLPLKIKFISISTPWGGDDLANIGVKYSPAVIPAWREIRSDGKFIESLYEKKLSEKVEHCLFFSYNGNNNPFRPNNDKVVTLQSELDFRAQSEARMVFGINEDHDSILISSQLVSQMNAILKPRSSDQDSGGMLKISFSYDYPSELPRPQPFLYLRSLDDDRLITMHLREDSSGAEVGPIPPGTYRAGLIAHAFMPEPSQTTVSLTGSGTPELNFLFKPRGSLIGAIVKPPRENNQAGLITFPDDSIKVESVRLRGSGLERQAMPVEGELKFLEHYLAEKDYYHNGIFYFFNLPEGEYELSVDARGYQKFVARYKVVPGQNYNLMNIVLQRASTRNGLYGR